MGEPCLVVDFSARKGLLPTGLPCQVYVPGAEHDGRGPPRGGEPGLLLRRPGEPAAAVGGPV